MVQGRWWDQSIGGGVRRGMGWSELREEGTELRLMGRQQLHMAGGAGLVGLAMAEPTFT